LGASMTPADLVAFTSDKVGSLVGSRTA